MAFIKLFIITCILYNIESKRPPPPKHEDDGSFVITQGGGGHGSGSAGRSVMPPPVVEKPIRHNPSKFEYFYIKSDIRYRFCTTEITAQASNYNPMPSEINFMTVLPDTAFISKFVLEIDGIEYKATVKEKDAAKQTYQDAINRGQSAGLIEANTRNSNTFNLNINIKANSVIRFILTYEELLMRNLEHYEQVINIISQQASQVNNYAVTVNILENQKLKFVKVMKIRNDLETNNDEQNKEASIEHPTDNSASITWRKGNSFLLTSDIGKFIVKYDVERNFPAGEIMLMNGYFVHFFAPDVKPMRKHVVYVLDISGSMSGRKIEQLRSAMLYVLDDLKPDDYFNIITFHSDVKIWSPDTSGEISSKSPIKVTESNLEKAHRFIKSLAAMGSTNIHEALTDALNLIIPNQLFNPWQSILIKEEKKPESIIVFLTDGEPTVGVTDLNQIMNGVKQKNQEFNVPIFSLAFGTGADFNFLKKLSMQNHGFARKIYEAADSDLQLKGFYAGISSPLLSKINFKYTTPDSVVPYTIYDYTIHSFPNYFHGSEIIVSGRYQRSDMAVARPLEKPNEVDPDKINVNIQANGRDGHVNFGTKQASYIKICPTWRCPPWPPRPWPIPIPPPPRTTTIKYIGSPEAIQEDRFLERFWAYLTIKQLIEKDFLGKMDSYNGETPKQRALRLSLQYEFVTSLTSLVVVKPESSIIVSIEPYRPPQLDYHTMNYMMNGASGAGGGRVRAHKSSMRLAGGISAFDSGPPPMAPMAMSKAGNNYNDYAEDEAESEPLMDDSGKPVAVKKSKHKMTQEKPKNLDAVAESVIVDGPMASSNPELKKIKWLTRRSIWKDNVVYRVSEIDKAVDKAECAVQGKKGNCVHLKDCVIKEIMIDKDKYMNTYFCHLKGKNEDASMVYAGTCCVK